MPIEAAAFVGMAVQAATIQRVEVVPLVPAATKIVSMTALLIIVCQTAHGFPKGAQKGTQANLR